MKIAIVCSTKDPASMNIKDSLDFRATDALFDKQPILENNYAEIYTTDKDSIHCEDIDKKIDADFFIFASKHQSASGHASLSVHAIGNWGKAEYGGRDRQLCLAPHFALKKAMIILNKNNDMHYEVIQEATHHGPYLVKPVMFIEIGSSLEEWQNKDAGKIIASTILELCEWLQSGDTPTWKKTFGIGGLHHTPNFRRLVLEEDIAIGHVCPKYNLDNLDEEMIKQAMLDSEEIILDWKSMGEHKTRIVGLLEELKINYKKKK